MLRPDSRSRCGLALAGLVLGLLAAGPAQAASRIRVETQETRTSNGKAAAALVVNGDVVAELSKEDGGLTPLRSISAAATLLTAEYRRGKLELKVQPTDSSNRRWVVFLNGRALLVAHDLEAKAWGVEPQALARTWQRKLTEALQGGPPPESSAQPGSAGQSPPAAHKAPGAPAKPQSGALNVGGQRPAEAPVATVLERAPDLPAGAIVTGSRPGPDVVNPAVEAALRFENRIPGNAALSWKRVLPEEPKGKPGDKPKTPPELTAGPGKSVKAQVEYAAGGAQPAAAELTLFNRTLATPRESLTLFSNSPESVYGPQLLYEAELPAGRAARLVYHHQNQAQKTLRFVIRVLSENGAGALHVVPGTANPDINTFFVGFKSAENFWRNANAGNGYAVPLSEAAHFNLLAQDLGYGYTSSGYMKLTNLGERTLRLEVLALPAGQRAPDKAAQPAATTTRCVFDSPYFARSARYSVGDPWLYLRLGDGRPESTTDDTVLHGCYGMTHSYDVELRNDTGAPSLLFVVLRGSAGEVKGQFYLDDEYVVTPLVAGGDERLLRELPLRPGETKLLKIRAIALNGGFYPASIIVRETRDP